MTSPVPVVLFAYDRTDFLERTLAGLRANRVPLLYAYSDGPRTAASAAGVAAVRAMLRRVDWADVRVIERADNFGLGKSIVTGVTEVLANHSAAIVTEDDLVIAPGTYAWMVAALDHYRDDPRVMSVGAWTHPRVTPHGTKDRPFFSTRVNTYFWGTWARGWSGMAEGTAADRFATVMARGEDPGRYGRDLLDQAATERERNIWAVRWIAHHFVRPGLSLCAPWTMVDHIGSDPRSTNVKADPVWTVRIDRPAPPIPVDWPEPVEHPEIAKLWRRGVDQEYRLARRTLWKRIAGRVRRLFARRT